VVVPNHDGRAGCAAIVPSSTQLPELSELATYLKENLPRYTVPLFIRVTEELRLTGNMKHRKHLLREEGIDPAKCHGDELFWLRDGTYMKFGDEDWQSIVNGTVEL
jgi:acyl-CoA synthetase (AMP-forming)/AMP-acid ligase II